MGVRLARNPLPPREAALGRREEQACGEPDRAEQDDAGKDLGQTERPRRQHDPIADPILARDLAAIFIYAI